MPLTQFPIATVLATKALLGLGNVDNTPDLLKPISNAVQAALDQKRSALAAIPLADLAQSGATTGQVLKWNGTAWAPGTDLVGSGGGGGAVTSVFGRTGDITPQSNDYTFAQIGSKPNSLSGYGITDAAPSSHVASGGSAHAIATTGSAGFMSSTDKTKLDGIASGATANDIDANLKNRDNHTGTQAISTIVGLQSALDAKAPTANPTFTGTVAGITKAMVGLGAVDNTSDAAKPVSTAQATAISARHVNMTFQLAGVAQGSAGTVDTINATGALSLVRATNTVTLGVSDATGSATGAVQLAGALGGTAAAPTALGYASAAALAAALAAKANIAPTAEDIPIDVTYTLVSADNGKVKYAIDVDAQTVVVPTGLPTPFAVMIAWPAGSGTVTLDAAAGVNINGAGDGVNVTLSAAGGSVYLVKRGATENFIAVGSIGDLLAADITDSTTVGRALLTAADAAAGRTALGLGSVATLASTAVGQLAVAQSWTAAQAVTPVALTDAATVAVDASLSNNFTLVLGGNRTLGAPSNPRAGQPLNIRIRQDATGNRTLSFNAAYLFPGGTDPVLSTAANASDLLCCVYDSVLGGWLCNMTKAYA